jgi:RNA polymerase sigma factor (sigma-70 family)
MYASTAEQRSRERVQALADQLYRERRPYLLRIAVKNSATEADAEEAVQFAFLAFIEHFDPNGESPPLAWLTLVAKRECWARYRRLHLDRNVGQEAARSSGEPGASVESIQSHSSGPAELVQRVEGARANLAGLKPAERRALGLIAAGYSYAEVGEITGWSYTKINRCAAEGRAALRKMAAA